jgi:hypothetical protein
LLDEVMYVLVVVGRGHGFEFTPAWQGLIVIS